MTIIARICFAAGAAASIAGLGIALAAVADAVWASRPLLRAPVQLSESAFSHLLYVGDPAARVGLGLTVAPGDGSGEIRGNSGRVVDHYRFPLHYRVHDESGRLLIDQRVIIDSAGRDTFRRDYVERPDATPATVHAVFDAFPVPADGRIRIEARLLPDDRHGADIAWAELRLFRQPTPAAASVRQGLAALLAGLGLMLLGLLGELLWPRSRVRRPTHVSTASRVLAFRPHVVPTAVVLPSQGAPQRAL